MNCCDEYGDCRQGRDCPVRQACELPEPQTPADIDAAWRLVRTGMAWIGFFAMLALTGFFYG